MPSLNTRGQVLLFVRLYRALGAIRAPFIIALIACLMLVLPDQSLEVYRVLIEDFEITGLTSALTTTVILCGVIWQCTSALGNDDRITRALAILISVLPLLALSLGLVQSGPAIEYPSAEGTKRKLIFSAFIVLFVAALCAVMMQIASEKLTINAKALFSRGVIIGVTSVLATAVAAEVFFPSPLPAAVGPVGVLVLFLSFLCFYASWFTYIHNRNGVPVTLLLVACAIVFSPLNNNHRIRAEPNPSMQGVPSLRESFMEWYRSRGDLTSYGSDKPYPVYIVAAEGGGIYAAYHTAIALAHVQELCPNFAQHIFAVSSVSGGSLGAALFAGLVEKFAQNGQRVECLEQHSSSPLLKKKVATYLRNDFLSPLLWAGLFPDFAQRFLPFPVHSFDRAFTLETAFEKAWARTFQEDSENFFQKRLRQSWDPKGSVPALIINTTEAAWGTRELISPFPISTDLLIQSGFQLGFRYDMSISSAVGLSARFPWITPPGWFRVGEQTIQLVDGGYFDNTGIETALNIISGLVDSRSGRREEEEVASFERINAEENAFRVSESLPPIKLILLTIRVKDLPTSRRGFGEVTSPLLALMRTRMGRSKLTVQNLRFLLCRGCSSGMIRQQDPVRSLILDSRSYQLPLGWLISSATARYIDSHFDGEAKCEGEVRVWDSISRINKCSVAFLVKDMK